MDNQTNLFGQEIPRDELFHYTSMEGLIGIVSRQTLWASNIEFLNDSSEFQHGKRVLKKIIDRRKRSARGDGKEFFNKLQAFPDIWDAEDVFLVSLSEVGDLLSQWRGYTPTGAGYSIGFDPQALGRATNALNHMQLVRCVYDANQQEQFAEQLLNECLQRWLTGHEESEGRMTISPPLLFRVYATFLAASLKDESFAEEREWRLLGVCRDLSRFRFRANRSTLTRYLELTWGGGTQAPDLQPIRSVTVGPCPNPVLAQKALRKLIQASGAETASITISKIPFRAW